MCKLDADHSGDVIKQLQAWYHSQCDGDWEHVAGISIGTVDNPGWTVSICIVGTPLEGVPFSKVSADASESDWYRCRVADGCFQGAGDPTKLLTILKAFLSWASAVPQEVQHDPHVSLDEE